MCLGVGNKYDSAVVGNIQPFVGIGCPGVGIFDPFDQVAQPVTGGHPQTECAIDVHPGIVCRANSQTSSNGSKAPRFKVNGGERNNRRCIGVFLKLGFQCGDRDSAIIFHRNADNGVGSDTEITQGAQQGFVVLPDQYANRRAAGQPLSSTDQPLSSSNL